MRADRAGPTGPAAGAAAAPVGAGGVHGPEPGGGQGEEHGGVLADGVGHALAAADGARVQQLPQVARVLVRAGRADHRAPVPAPDQQHLVGLGGGRPGLDPAVGVGADEPAAQPDRAGAVPTAADLPLPRLEVRAAGAVQHLGEGPGVGEWCPDPRVVTVMATRFGCDAARWCPPAAPGSRRCSRRRGSRASGWTYQPGTPHCAHGTETAFLGRAARTGELDAAGALSHCVLPRSRSGPVRRRLSSCRHRSHRPRRCRVRCAGPGPARPGRRRPSHGRRHR